MRLGAPATVIQISATTPSTASRPSRGRLLATAGWAVKPRRLCMIPPERGGGPRRGGDRGEVVEGGVIMAHYTGMLMMSL